ncbi:MAG: restriction endonuclease [Azonexus sp.]|nr:restriction endonuclease [Azonexus sp.]
MGRDKYLLQCKQWKAMKVGVAVVRELYGVMTAERAVGGFVVVSGEFTADAQAFVEGRSITLVSARPLQKMAVNGAANPVTRKVQQALPEIAVPACPKCGKPMVSRLARQGTRAGQFFWGCGDFSTCSGVRNP